LEDLKYEIRREPDRLTVLLEGELDMRLAPSLRRVFETELKRPPRLVVIDLGSTEFIDSSIVATLIIGLKLVLAKGGEMRVVNARQPVRDTFEISGLLDRFGIE